MECSRPMHGRRFCYHLFGLQLQSNLPLPGLAESKIESPKEIEVRFQQKPSVWLKGQYRAETLRFRSERPDECSLPVVQVWSLDDFGFRFLYCDGTEFFVDRLGTCIWATWPSSLTWARAPSARSE